jgi:hypothetical protein
MRKYAVIAKVLEGLRVGGVVVIPIVAVLICVTHVMEQDE